MGEKHRKARVTAEHREEAAKLYALWKATNHGLTQAEFGERYAVGNQSAVGQFLRGDAPLSQKAAAGFAKGLGCSIAAFSPRIASELNERKAHEEKPGDDEFALVQRADVKLSAGHGHIVYHEGSESALSFRRSFLREIGVNESNAVIVGVTGRSMEPTIRDGAVLLVSKSATTIIDREIYAFRLDGELFVKRLRKRDGEVTAESDNPDKQTYPDMSVVGEEFEMIGRALWTGSKL